MSVVKTDSGMEFDASAYLIVPDPEKPSGWKIRTQETPGHVTVAQLGRAAAALTKGFRGNKVQAKPEEISAAKSKLIGLYHKMEAKPPSDLEDGAKECHITETFSIAGAAIEDINGIPTIRNVTLISPGTSANKRMYSESMLSQHYQVFENAPVFATNHREEQKDIRSMAGVVRNTRYVPGVGIQADLEGFQSDLMPLQKALELHQRLGKEKIGLSIDTMGRFSPRKTENGILNEVVSLYRTPHTSVDLVINPACGGRLAESIKESNEVLEKIAKLSAADLERLNSAGVKYITEGLSDDEIREANAELAEAIIAKRERSDTDTSTTSTTEVKTMEIANEAKVSEARTMTEADVQRLVEAQVKEAEKKLTSQSLLLSRISEVNDPLVREALKAKFEGKVFESEILDAEVKRLRDLAAKSNPVRVHVPGSAQVTESYDINKDRLEATFMARYEGKSGFGTYTLENGRTVKPFNSISQMVTAFHPETVRTWVDSPTDAAQECMQYFHWGNRTAQRASEALETGDLTGAAFADVLNRVLFKVVMEPGLNVWRPLVSSYVSFKDLTNTYKFVRVGEVGTLATVNEGAAYQDFTKPTTDKQALSIAKKGNMYPLTWEAILRDDIGVLAKIPVDLGRSWLWTVNDTIFALLQANSGAGQTMDVDSNALYHAAHSNIATSAFSGANLETVRQKMPKQTDPDSSKRKMYQAKYLLYATPDLDQPIMEALSSSYKLPAAVTNAGEVNLPNWIKALGLEGVPVVYPTSTTTRWELIADPAQADTLAVGFLGGKDTPDIVIQNAQENGAMFSADTITYKVRGAVGAAAVNFRSFSRGNT